MINDGTEPFCGGAVCQKVRTFGNYFSHFNIIFYLDCICRPVREQRPVLSVVTEIRRFGMEVHMLSSVTTAHQNSQKLLA